MFATGQSVRFYPRPETDYKGRPSLVVGQDGLRPKGQEPKMSVIPARLLALLLKNRVLRMFEL